MANLRCGAAESRSGRRLRDFINRDESTPRCIVGMLRRFFHRKDRGKTAPLMTGFVSVQYSIALGIGLL